MITLNTIGGPLDALPIGVEVLTLGEAVQQALMTDPSIQAALARALVARAEAHQSRLLPNPILTVVLRFPESGGSPMVEASLAADLLSLLQRPGRIRAADHRLRAASAQAVATVLDVLGELQERYAQVQSLDAQIGVMEQRRTLLGRLLELARSRLRVGEGIRLDVTTLDAQRVELEIEIAETQLERREARLALARRIGRPSDDTAWALDPWQPPMPPTIDESAWIAAGLEHRPEVAARMWELTALGVEVKLARWALFDGAEAGVESERDGGEWSVGPGFALPLPLLDWGQAKRGAARARRLEAVHELTRVRRQVVEEVRRAHTAFRSRLDTLALVRDQLIPLLDRRRDEAESAYRAGESDVIALVLAEQELQAGRAKLIELQRETTRAMIQLHRAAGGPGDAPPHRDPEKTPEVSP